jgi:hypothetical protein
MSSKISIEDIEKEMKKIEEEIQKRNFEIEKLENERQVHLDNREIEMLRTQGDPNDSDYAALGKSSRQPYNDFFDNIPYNEFNESTLLGEKRKMSKPTLRRSKRNKKGGKKNKSNRKSSTNKRKSKKKRKI